MQNSLNGWPGINLTNTHAGTSALPAIAVRNGTAGTDYGLFGTGGKNYTPLAILQNMAFIDAGTTTGGIALNTEGAVNPIVFGTNSAERMRITAGGNVGIGTTSPGAGLDVATTGTTGSALIVPRDTTANRPSVPVNGMVRYNSTTAGFEGYANGAWASIGPLYLIQTPLLAGNGTMTNGNVCPSSNVTIPVAGKYKVDGTWEMSGATYSYAACFPTIGGGSVSTSTDGYAGIQGASGTYASGHFFGYITLTAGSQAVQWTCAWSGGSGIPECQRWAVQLMGPLN